MDNWRRFRIGGGANAGGQTKDTAALDLVNGSADGKGKDREIGDEFLWGLENFGNTCYCNSVLQALYASLPFRHFVEAYPDVASPYNPLGGPVATEPIRTPSPDNAAGTTANGKANGHASDATPSATTGTKEKRGLSFGFGKKSSNADATPKPAATLQPAAPAAAAQPAPPPIILPHDPNFPDMTLFSTIQTLFHHLSTSLPHHPAAPKTPAPAANGQTNATGNNAASLPSASLSAATSTTTTAAGGAANNGQPQGPSLLASLPPPSTPRGGGPYHAGTLGRGVVRPEDVLRTVRKHHVMFAGQGQQDAHEFLGFMLNQLAEEVERLDNELKERGQEVTTMKERGKTFIHNLFQGVLVNETRCLNCETTSSREESFLDLSIDIEQHSSLTACLRQFSHSEMLCSTNKFYCETCCSLVEAERRMRIKSLPNILGLHLKRFRQDEMGRLHKLFYRVTFPLQLRVPCTTEDTEDAERLYELFAVVVHIGNGPTHGHYVTVVRAGNQWVMCDDENIEPIEEADLANYFGDNITGAGYVLFYQAVNLDLKSLGLKKIPERRVAPSFPKSVPIVEVDEGQAQEALATGAAAGEAEDPRAVEASEAASAVSGTSAPVPTTPLSDIHPQPLPNPTAPVVVPPTKPALTVDMSAKAESSGSSRGATPNGSVHAESPATTRTGTAGRREATTSTFLRRDTSATRSPQEKSKWYSLKKRESMSHTALASAASASPAASAPTAASRPDTIRRSTTTTLNTTASSMNGHADDSSHRGASQPAPTADHSTPSKSQSHSPVRAGTAETHDLSSSMISTSTNSSNQSSSLAVPIPRGTANATHATRSASMSRPDRGYSMPRPDRTASGTQINGSAPGSHGQSGFSGGTSLGRKISGAAGFGKFKMGFGKKNRVDE